MLGQAPEDLHTQDRLAPLFSLTLVALGVGARRKRSRGPTSVRVSRGAGKPNVVDLSSKLIEPWIFIQQSPSATAPGATRLTRARFRLTPARGETC
jgi:hypothetical protein